MKISELALFDPLLKKMLKNAEKTAEILENKTAKNPAKTPENRENFLGKLAKTPQKKLKLL